jgi:hypothetical protein
MEATMSGLSPRAKAVLQRGARWDQPSQDDRARLRGRIRQGIALSACGASAVTSTKAAAAGLSKLSGAASPGALPAALATKAAVSLAAPISKLALGLALSGLTAGGLYTWSANRGERLPQVVLDDSKPGSAHNRSLVCDEGQPSEQQPHSKRDAETSSVTLPWPVPQTKPAAATPAVTESAPRVAPRQSKKRTREVASSTLTKGQPRAKLGDELGALREIQQRVRDGQYIQALNVLAKQDVEHALGQLAQERAALQILILCRLGRFSEGSTRLSEFARKHADSPLLGSVRRACEVADP